MSSMTQPAANGFSIRAYATLFWDFDGVIKESVAVKADAFEQLFAPFGAELAARVREHHERHGGLSRFEKVPLYLEWAGCDCSPAEVARYCAMFSAAVLQQVVDCAWVPGAREYLLANSDSQRCVLISATPQAEIEHIVRALGVEQCFREVHGAPTPKQAAVTAALGRLERSRKQALLIGDSEADFDAAKAAGVSFLLRRTPFNRALQEAYIGPQCDNFSSA